MKTIGLRGLGWGVPVLLVVGLIVYQKIFTRVPAVAHAVSRGLVVGEVAGTGTLEARVTTTISARIQERLAEVMVDQGDKITKGQLLARIYKDEAELALKARKSGFLNLAPMPIQNQ